MTARPDQWLAMRSHGGEIEISVVVNDQRGSVWFRGIDLDDLKQHVDVAIAQRNLRCVRGRGGPTAEAPPWLKQDHVWAYCLYILGDTMWGVVRCERRLDELRARYGSSARPDAGPDRH